MTVARILANKGRDVVTAQPHHTIREICELLERKNIGAVVVVGPDREVLGIISERDVVRVVARRGAGGLDELASAHMTAKVATTEDDTAVDAIMESMTAGRFRHVPVMNAGRLSGLVSIGDVVKFRLDEIEAERLALREYIATA